MKSNVTQSSFVFIQIVLLSTVFISLPLFPKITSISIALLFVSSFFYSSKRSVKEIPKVYFLFPAFFLFYAISIIFSDNIIFWSKDIETKLSFIVIPIIFFNLKRDLIKHKERFYLLFIIGVLISAVLSYFKGMECWDIQRARFCFESSHLAYNFHPSYLSLYYIIAILISWILAFSSKYNKLWFFLAIITTIVLGYFIYHFYSVGPWIAFIFTVLMLFLYFFLVRKQIVKFIISVVILSVISTTAITKLDLFESDFNVIAQELSEFTDSPQKYYENNKGNTSSTKARIIIWGITIKLIKENKFGVGGGDIKDVLIKRYSDLGLNEYVKKELNPHNQYLQTALALGVLVGLFLFLTIVVLIVYAVKNENVILISVLSLLLISMFFESMLEKQGGVVFFVFIIYYNLELSLTNPVKND